MVSRGMWIIAFYFCDGVAIAQILDADPKPAKDLTSLAVKSARKLNAADQALSYKSFLNTLDRKQTALLRAGVRSNLDDAEIDRVTNSLKSHYAQMSVVSTLQIKVPQSTDLVSFECVPIALQPALQSRTNTESLAWISEPPPGEGNVPDSRDQFNPPPSPNSNPPKIAHPSTAASCPPGLVPIRRHTVAEMLSLPTSKGDVSASKFPSPGLDRNALRLAAGKKSLAPEVSLPYKHRYAHALAFTPNKGVSSRLNVWSPRVEPGDMSLSQVWVVGGAIDVEPLQTVEAGWQVMNLWNTPFSAFFVYATADDYRSTGCYVTKCKANDPIRPESFVFRNNKAVIGAPVAQQGSADEKSAVVDVMWVRSETTGSWWLKVDKDWIGFYPSVYFGNGPLATKATYVDFGGEATGYSPSAQMGSGQFASLGRGRAAYQSRLSYIGLDGKLYPAEVKPFVTDPGCYTIEINSAGSPETAAGTYFYFGGPGTNRDPKVDSLPCI